MIVRDMAGNDYFEKENQEERVWSPVHKIELVIRCLLIRLQLQCWEIIAICKDGQVLNKDTLLGTLADPTGRVELSSARFTTSHSEMARAALARAQLHAEAGEWEAWSRELSEVDRLEAAERNDLGLSSYSNSVESSPRTPL